MPVFRRALLSLCCFFLALPFAHAADTYRVLHTYPHDPNAFTQGLVFSDGQLYESDGLNGRSSLRMDDLTSGKVLQHFEVPSQYFAEGLTDWGSTLIQLTWKAHLGFVYDRFSFRLLRTFHYDGEGWGLTHDDHSLILSDGTDTLRYLNPQTFAVERRLRVTDHGAPVTQINELEYIHGQIYANIWQTDKIAIISPRTGDVTAWIDMSGLLPEAQRSSPDAVLNGIAYDPRSNQLYVTGKLWPSIFQIKIVPQKQ
jgi:glutaminyl-peptide cyclotransferase